MSLAEHMPNAVMGFVPHGPVQQLTPRQFEEVDQGSLGFTIPERADIRVLSKETIKTLRSGGIKNLVAVNIAHATRVGFEQNILKPSLGLNPADYAGLLGPVQIEELVLASYGLSTRAAAAIRGVSAATTAENRKIIREKLGAKTIAHAVRIGIEAQIILKDLDTTEMPEIAAPVPIAA